MRNRTGHATRREVPFWSSADVVLAALAVAPPAFALFELSGPTLFSRAPTYLEIYAVYRYRRPLVASGTLAGAALLWRAPKGMRSSQKLA